MTIVAVAGVGHNSDLTTHKELRQLVERIETLEETKKDIADDIKDVYLEAKSRGFDGKTIRAIVKIRKLSTQVYQEQQTLLETYLEAFGIE